MELVEIKSKRKNVSEIIIDTIKRLLLIMYYVNTMVFMVYM